MPRAVRVRRRTTSWTRPTASPDETVTPRSNYVTSLYDSPESANRAYQELTSTHGYGADDIDVLMTDETRQRHFGDVKPGTELSSGSKAAKGFGAGSAIGGGVGAALATIFAVGTSVVVPGLGLVVAGPIAAALAGAGAGGATGGVIGALIGAGIPEERAGTTSAASSRAAFCSGRVRATSRKRWNSNAISASTVAAKFGGN